jgi:acetyltransferase-like isoleucine patch superfamily enzyme
VIPAFARLRGTLLHWSSPQFFKRIGRGVSFYGRVRTPMPFRKITIGDNAAICEYLSIRDPAHNFAVEQGVREQGFKVVPMDIGKNVWIGRGVFMGPSTIIADNSIVPANSVLQGKFPPGILIAGAATYRSKDARRRA